MTRLSNKSVLTAVTFVALFAFQAPASADPIPVTVVVGEIAGTTESVIGLTGFSTDGSDMAGMFVTAFFANEESASGVWTPLGPGAGHASGSTVDGDGNLLSFDLSQGGDTFTSVWGAYEWEQFVLRVRPDPNPHRRLRLRRLHDRYGF